MLPSILDITTQIFQKIFFLRFHEIQSYQAINNAWFTFIIKGIISQFCTIYRSFIQHLENFACIIKNEDVLDIFAQKTLFMLLYIFEVA